jgi:hypothetical protein
MSRYFLTGFLVLTVVLANAPQRNQSDNFKFEIVSVKALNEVESKRIAGPDFIGADVLVRLRLSATDRDLFFSGFRQLKIPVGYRIKWEGDQKIWLAPEAGVHGQRKSPGIGGLRLSVEWCKVEKGKTIEWELMDGTDSVGETHGESTFIKFQLDDKPIEIFSDSYQVPAPVASKK